MLLKVAVLFSLLSIPVFALEHADDDLPTPEPSTAPWSQERREIEEQAEKALLVKTVERRLRIIPKAEAEKLAKGDVKVMKLPELRSLSAALKGYLSEHTKLTDEAKQEIAKMKDEVKLFRSQLARTEQFTRRVFASLRKSINRLDADLAEEIPDMKALAELQDRLIAIDDSITFAIRSTWFNP